MFTEIEIKERLAPIKSVFKADAGKKDKVSTGFHPTFDTAVKHSKELRVHADGKFPTMLINESHPNESDVEFEYRKRNYQAITKPAWAKGTKAINRIWNPNNYTVQWQEDDKQFVDDPAQTYFEKEYPTYGSIYKYFSSIVMDMMLKDPNALLIVKPRDIPTKLDENNDQVADQNALIEPIAVIYSSWQIMTFVEDVFALILTSRKSQLDDDKEGNTGLIFEFYDDTNIWILTQTGDKKDFTFKIELWYAHNLGMVPVSKLPGISAQLDEFPYLESFFAPALPNLNEAVIDNSTLFMAKQGHAFPQKWEYVQPCPNKDCNGGRVIRADMPGDDGSPQSIDCPTCSGTGLGSPFKVKQIPIPNSIEDNSVFGSIATPPGGFIEPGTNILEFIRNAIEFNIVSAFVFVGLEVSITKVKGSETALGKMIDREETFAFLMRISNDAFPLLSRVINQIGSMRYSVFNGAALDNKFQSPKITPPVDFSIRTEAELVEEIKRAREAGVTTDGIKELNKLWVQKRFNTDKNSDQIIDLLFFSDSLVVKKEEDINKDLLLDKINRWQAVLHDSFNIYVQESVIDDPKFFDKELADQRTVIVQKAEADALALEPKIPGTSASIIAASTTPIANA